jgi:hypothetical protein
MSTLLSNGITVPKTYRPGLGFSPSSGPQVGGLGVNANPSYYSSTFFGDNVKALFPLIGQNSFGKKKRSKKRKVKKSRKRKFSKKSRKRKFSKKSRKGKSKRVSKQKKRKSKKSKHRY